MTASQALGSLAVGNIQKFLPFMLNQIEGQPTRQYLLIHALKEVRLLLFFQTGLL